jgi:hypothetical protein
VKGYIPWFGQVKRKRDGGNRDSCRIILVVYTYVLGRSSCVCVCVCVLGQGAFVSMFWGQSAYVFVVLGSECLCNLFRIE